MTPEELEKWRKAGKIASQALAYGVTLIKKGACMRDVCDQVDEKIVELGALPAWPAQIGNDHVAAHFTPDQNDESLFNQEVVSLDVGAHVDGYVGDCAITVDLSGKWTDLVKASREALTVASKMLAPGIAVGELGTTIQEVIASYGFTPVRNLSGHGISRFVIHDSPGIPNHANTNKQVLKEGQVVALEPFATTGRGLVRDADSCNLFSFFQAKPVRSPYAREVLAFIQKKYGPLPFTTRWISRELGLGKARLGIKELVIAGALHPHPPLVEVSHGMVTVEENTFLIGEKTETLTKA